MAPFLSIINMQFPAFNPSKTMIGAVVAIFWTIIDPPGLQGLIFPRFPIMETAPFSKFHSNLCVSVAIVSGSLAYFLCSVV